MRQGRTAFALAAALTLTALEPPGIDAQATTPAAPSTPSPYESVLQGLQFREIGPAVMGGRIDDFAVVESNPSIVYAGTASAGVWKTINAGTTWTPLFDNEAVSTIGDVTLAPSDPSIVWVGTGEPNNRQSSSWGNGVYKSTDAGRTWRHAGLRETHHIGRIAIHPANPDIVYVAAVGRLWGPNKERGVFKTTDGGATWQHVLAINEDTGVVDLVLNPQSPDTVYAAAYQRRRTVFGFAGSGPHGGIHKTTDGGKTWKKLEQGLPWAAPASSASSAASKDSKEKRLEIGRIGLNVYRRDPRIVYATIEHENGGTFRSEDHGETWTRMSATNPRPMYYSKIYVDPNNDQRIWVLGAQMFYSEDGGKTFNTDRVDRIHSDHHALWINPADSNHMLIGSDGGISWSWDAGRSWDFTNNLAIGQFYELGVDMRQPYFICGGMQDNNTWCGPSASMNPRGIPNSDWFTIAGGDGFYAQIDPTDPETVYAESQDGNLVRRDLRTGESKSIRPQPAEGAPQYRFQWNSPIVISSHDAKTIYYGGNHLFKSTDRGDTWTTISPDLTSGVDRNSLPIFGRVPDRQTRSRHDGVRHYPALTQVAESTLDRNLLWAGSDDGLIHVTRDGGKTWKNVIGSIPGVPKNTYVTRIVASRHAAGTAYVTFDGHRNNDFNIYAFATADFGETWKAIRTGIPDNLGVLNVIREHPKNPDLLFAGGEYGAYVSFSRGARWVPLKLNLPTVPVDDIVIHPRDNDLIFGTHGRSIWVLDDIAPLVELNDTVLAKDLHLFSARPGIQWRQWSNTGSTGHKMFLGQNPPYGVTLTYYLKSALPQGQPARLVVQDASGKTIRELQGSAKAGLNRVGWDTRQESPVPPAAPGTGGGGFGGGGGGGGGFGGAGGGGPRVEPGEYTIEVTAGSHKASGKFVVQEDPRITMTPADRLTRRQAIDRLLPLVTSATIAQRTVVGLRTALVTQMDAWKRPNAARVPEQVTKAANALLEKIDAIYPNFATPPSEAPGLGDAGPPLVERPPTIPQRVLGVYGALANTTAAPTAWQTEQIAAAESKLGPLMSSVKALAETDLPALNKLMNEAGVTHVTLPPVTGPRRTTPPPQPGGVELTPQ